MKSDSIISAEEQKQDALEIIEILKKQKQEYEKEIARKKELEELELYLKEKKEILKKQESLKQTEKITKRNNIDISYYLETIKNKKTKEMIEEILKDEENKEEIINLLILHYTKEKTELMNLIMEEYDIDILKDFKEEILKLDTIIKTLIEIKKVKEEKTEEKNNLMCLTKISKENIIIDDIENILSKNPNESTLKDFKDLLESIIDGTFKGIKRFRNNNRLSGLAEVKQNNARIIFQRIDKNTYIIIYMFIKDCRKDKLYQDTLKSRADLYLAQKEELKENLTEDTIKVLEYFKGAK